MRWNVRREASFGVYPYRGIEQFNDLDTANLDFSDFPILSELMLGRDGDSNASSSFDSSDVEGATAERLVPHLVLDADSSQFISLMKVAVEEKSNYRKCDCQLYFSGKNFVFAEKSTRVVFSRLKTLGLSDFVLPLMGAKYDKFYQAMKKELIPNIAKTDLI